MAGTHRAALAAQGGGIRPSAGRAHLRGAENLPFVYFNKTRTTLDHEGAESDSTLPGSKDRSPTGTSEKSQLL